MPAVVSRGRGRRTINEINMVPFIDVMLVLLIIFMAVPPTNSPNVINLPNAQKSTAPPNDYILLSIKPNCSLSIGLFAAIPAVVAYNRFSHDIDRLATRFETFVEEFSNILQRQSR